MRCHTGVESPLTILSRATRGAEVGYRHNRGPPQSTNFPERPRLTIGDTLYSTDPGNTTNYPDTSLSPEYPYDSGATKGTPASASEQPRESETPSTRHTVFVHTERRHVASIKVLDTICPKHQITRAPNKREICGFPQRNRPTVPTRSPEYTRYTLRSRKPDRPRVTDSHTAGGGEYCALLKQPTGLTRRSAQMGGRGPRTTPQVKLDKFAFTKDTSGATTQQAPTPTNAESEGQKEVTLQDIMSTLSNVQTTVGSISADVSFLRADFQKMATRVTEVENTTASLTKDTATLQRKVQQLEAQNRQLTFKLDDQEGRSRHNNVRITGVPESKGVQAMDLYIEKLITTQVQPRGLSTFFLVERAHRVPGGKPKPGAPPRPILARLFNFRDRDAILQTARVAPPIRIDNSVISFFPDYKAAVTKQRRSFLEVKKELRRRELAYSML